MNRESIEINSLHSFRLLFHPGVPEGPKISGAPLKHPGKTTWIRHFPIPAANRGFTRHFLLCLKAYTRL